MRFYKCQPYYSAIGYFVYDEKAHRDQISAELYTKRTGRSCESKCFLLKNCSYLFSLINRIPLYIVWDGSGYHEFFSGVCVTVYPDWESHIIRHEIVVTSMDEISAIEFESKTNKVSPIVQKTIVSKLSTIYEKACREADLYEQGKLRIEAELLQKTAAEKAAAERLSRKFN